MIFPRITRISANKTSLIGSKSATISEIRGEFWAQTRTQVLI